MEQYSHIVVLYTLCPQSFGPNGHEPTARTINVWTTNAIQPHKKYVGLALIRLQQQIAYIWMYPVIDIPPSSPSLKRTQREANFLSRKDFSPEPNDPERSKATHRRGIE